MYKQRFIITVGIPASGKSTWAREQENEKVHVIERDWIRSKWMTESGNIHDYKYSKSKEKQVTDIQEELIKGILGVGQSVIVSDTNLNKSTRDNLESIAKEFDLEMEIKIFDTPLHECIKRNRKRSNFVPEHVLINFERKMREYLGKYTYNENNPQKLPECILVDIDGSIADMKGIRGPFEWDKVHLDRPRDVICYYVQSLITDYSVSSELTFCEATPKVIFFSGRDSCSGMLTVEWLSDKFYNVHDCELYMRKNGDMRPDTIVKEEMFDKYIKDKYHVSHIIDDRAAICRMWESIGFPVINVGGFLAEF